MSLKTTGTGGERGRGERISDGIFFNMVMRLLSLAVVLITKNENLVKYRFSNKMKLFLSRVGSVYLGCQE